MKRLHIVGRKNHGKTHLLEELVRELTGRGLRVATLKHSPHHHELDRPGKDSHRHRQAGANPAAIATPDLMAVYIPREPGSDAYERLSSSFAGCDLLLVEGDIESEAPKLEVWRALVGTPPLAVERDDILAVVSDDAPDVGVPVWSRNDVHGLADRILDRHGG